MGEDVSINLEQLIKSLEAKSAADYTPQCGSLALVIDPIDRMVAETTSPL